MSKRDLCEAVIRLCQKLLRCNNGKDVVLVVENKDRSYATADYTIKCRDCVFGEGTEKTDWLWCENRENARLVHKDGSCGQGVWKGDRG